MQIRMKHTPLRKSEHAPDPAYHKLAANHLRHAIAALESGELSRAGSHTNHAKNILAARVAAHPAHRDSDAAAAQTYVTRAHEWLGGRHPIRGAVAGEQIKAALTHLK